MDERSGPEARRKLLELLQEETVAMMATHHPDGQMHARPMAVKHVEFEGHLWFLTDANSEKVADIYRSDEVLLVYADHTRNHYVSVTGRAVIITERMTLAQLWTEDQRPWFPHGIEDPNLVAIRVDVEHAEYWDRDTRLMVLVYSYARGLLTGERPDGQGETGHVEF